MDYKPYRTLFFGVLKQRSDLSIGGRDTVSTVDMPVALDGKERPVLKGTSLAGVLLYTLRKLGHKIPPELALDQYFVDRYRKETDISPVQASSWKVSNSYLMETERPLTQLRQYVKIDAPSGTADDGALFDMQVITGKNDWFFMLEVVTNDIPEHSFKDDYPLSAEQLAAIALLNWSKEGLHLGRRSVAGTGWFELSSLKALVMDNRAVDLWPDNTLQLRPDAENDHTPIMTLENLAEKTGITLKDANALESEITETLSSLSIEKPRSDPEQPKPGLSTPFRTVFEIALTAGPRSDKKNPDLKEQSDSCSDTASNAPPVEEWGLDGFIINGHEAMKPLQLEDGRFFEDETSDWQTYLSLHEQYQFSDEDIPDSFFVYDENGDPFIPGSSLRGVIYHQMQRNLTDHADQKVLLESVFGSTDCSSMLFVGDARLESPNNWRGILLHNHAEDEFTGGPYGSSKFVRTSIIEGNFTGKIVLEARNQKTLQQQTELLTEVLKLGTQNQLPIGGKQWVDSGWLKWTYQSEATITEDK